MDYQKNNSNNDRKDIENSNDYIIDNYDDEGVSSHTRKINNSMSENDYGDDFDFQTGENNGDLSYDNDEENIEEYYLNMPPSKSASSRPKKTNKKQSKSKTVAIILICAAAVCLVIAIVVAFSQCSDNKKPNIKATASTAASTTVSVTENNQIETDAPDEPEQTESVIVTEAPTEIVTTAEPTTVPVYTDPPTEPQTTAYVADSTNGDEEDDDNGSGEIDIYSENN